MIALDIAIVALRRISMFASHYGPSEEADIALAALNAIHGLPSIGESINLKEETP